MNFKQKLGSLKALIDKELEHQFDVAIKGVKKEDQLLTDCLEYTKKIALSGGKRVRGALLMESYFGFGGKEKKKVLKIAAAIELVHLFLLMHDDIIDRGQFRHGEITLHMMLAKKYQKKYGEDEAVHFGKSMAIVVGDMLFAMSSKIIAEAGFESSVTLNALLKLQTIVSTTIVGQSQDINISYDNNVCEFEILKMYENKTARYTFEGPLHMGAILAGCSDKKSFGMLSSYAVPLGIAFQLQDDVLGVFGNEKEIGKSASSDIEEGKKTLMVIKAFSSAKAEEKKQIGNILGKKNLKINEVKKFRQLMVSTGSLGYCNDLAGKYFAKGKDEIEKIIILPEAKKFLVGMSEYLEKRKA